MTASSITVENGSTYSDYDLATKTETWASGTRHIPAGIIVDGTDGSIVRLGVYTEDVGLSGAETGLLPLVKRLDTRAAEAGTSGDASVIFQNAQGSLYVESSVKRVVLSLTTSSLTTMTTAYTAGDVLQGVLSTSGFARANGLTGRIVSCYMTDDSDVIGAVDLYVFDTTVSPGSDNAAYAPSDADNKLGLGVIQIPAALDASSNRAAFWSGSIPFVCTGSSTTLYFVPVTRSANAVFAGGASSLTFRLVVEQD